MKKIFVLILALALTFSLAACNGSSTGGSSTPANNTSAPANNSSAANNSTADDTSTVAGFLSQFGLTEDNVKPEDSVSSAMNGHTSVNFAVSTASTKDQKIAWVKKVITAIKAAADDGKIYKDSKKTGQYDESVLETSTGGSFSFVFTHNSAAYWVSATTEGFPLDIQYTLDISKE